MQIGRNALFYDDYVLSIQYFNLVISSKPYLFEPYFYRGLAKFYLEDFTGAEADCSVAIDKNPFFPDSYQVRGLARINLKDFSHAAEDYEKALEMNPTSQQLLNNLVLCRMENGNYESADTLADRMTRLWPNQAKGWLIKAEIQFNLKDTVQAESFIDKSLEHDGFNADALTVKATLLMQRELYAEADSFFTRSLQIQPRSVRNLINRALCRYHNRQLRGAMSDYDAALELDPDNFIGHYNRGQLRASVGEDNLALEDFDFILAKDPGDMMSTYNRALLRERTGNLRGAIQDYTTLIHHYPNFLGGYQRRAEARRRIGDVAGAMKDEEHLVREQIAHRFGYATASSRMRNKTRKRSEINFDDYDKLVVEDKEEETKVYESELRGKVQNKTTEAELHSVYALTYYANKKKNYIELSYHRELERINKAGILPQTLVAENREQPISEQEFNKRMASLVSLGQSGKSDAIHEFARAVDYYLIQDYENAINTLDEAIRKDSDFMLAHFLRSVVKYKTGMTAKTPDDTPSESSMGLPNVNLKRVHLLEAQANITRAIELAPDFAHAYYNRGVIRAELNDFQGAIEDFSQAISLKPEFPDAYYNRGLTHIFLHQQKEGITDLSKAGEQGVFEAYSLIKKYSKEKE